MAGGSSPMESKTSLFALPGYSKLGLLPPGSPPTLIKTLYFRRHTWKVKVYAGSFDKGIPSDISVVVSTEMKHSASGTNIRIEILDKCWEHAVFHTNQTLGSDSWFRFLTVERSQLEGSLCVDSNDNIPVRCTLTFLHLKKQKRQHQAAARSELWFQLRRRVSSYMGGVRNSNSILGSSIESNPDEVPAMVEHMPTLQRPNESSDSILVSLLIAAHG